MTTITTLHKRANNATDAPSNEETNAHLAHLREDARRHDRLITTITVASSQTEVMPTRGSTKEHLLTTLVPVHQVASDNLDQPASQPSRRTRKTRGREKLADPGHLDAEADVDEEKEEGEEEDM